MKCIVLLFIISIALLASQKEEFSIPFSLAGVLETDLFVGRTEEISRLRSEFQGDGSQRRVVLLHGMGGIGKTQLVVKFAKDYRNEYSAIFWLKGNNEESLKQSYTNIARRVQDAYPSFEPIRDAIQTNETDKIVDAVKKWLSLERNSMWILIFDNVDDFETYRIDRYLPDSHQGFVLVTTRCSQKQIPAAVHMPLGKLTDTSESIAILSHVSGRSISDQGSYQLSRY